MSSGPPPPSVDPLPPLKARVQVAVRIRPPLSREVGEGGRFTSCLGLGPTTDKGQTLFVSGVNSPVLLSGEGGGEARVSRYTFDRVFPLHTPQEEVFGLTMQDTLAAVLRGYNATVLAYGQTGSGKTHTMLGGGGREAEGLVPRTVRALLGDPLARVAVSVLQIYQEVVSDLLSPQSVALALRGGVGGGGVTVEGLQERQVASEREAGQLLEEALTRRVVAGTRLNTVSSRSHLVIRLVVRKGQQEARLNMVDLAGSERLKDSEAEGVTRQETAAINSSLFALVAVVESLSSGKAFVPYRNSKLTWLLSDSLGGNSLTTVLATVSPSQQYAGESKSTLKFGHSCKRIEHLVVQNTVASLRRSQKKLAPAPASRMPWASQEVTVTRDLVDTALGRVACYYTGPEDGPPLLLLHGCPSTFAEFRHLLPALTYAGFRVVGFDQAGYGASPGPRANSRSDKATEPGGPLDLLKAVIRYHGFEKPVLLGYDWGAGIALAYGVLHPARVASVVSFLPSYSETPDTLLQNLAVPTLVLWVKQDQNHSWKRFKTLVRKIPGVRIEFVHPPKAGTEYAGNCYEKLSDLVVQPILHFLTGEVVGGGAVMAVKGRELVTQSTEGQQVVEVCNVNFEDDLAPEEIEEILKEENPEANAVKMFENLGMRFGFDAVYAAEENHSHALHRSVCSVLRALPVLSPQRLAERPELLVEVGLWRSLPRGWREMVASPRYFPGRQVLVRVEDEEEEGGVTRIGRVLEVAGNSVQVEVDGDRGGFELCLDVSFKDIAELNQPHVFFFEEATEKLRLEDGIHCDYKARLVKAKMAEICLCLASLVEELDFRDPGEKSKDAEPEVVQQRAIGVIRSCLNMVTFQQGVDRSRVARSDCAGRLAVNGQGHCHGVSSTMAAFLLPVASVLGIDLKYRGCFTFGQEAAGPNNRVERHQCLEVSLRPGGRTYIVDLWMAEKYGNNTWLAMDMNTAYGRFMYPDGRLIQKTRPQPTESDFGGHKTAERNTRDKLRKKNSKYEV